MIITGQDNGSGNHVEPQRVTGATSNGNQPAAHRVPDLIPRITIDNNLATRHTAPAASIGRADQVPGVTFDMDTASMHFRADPICCVLLSDNLTAGHLGTKVHAGVACYSNQTI